MKTIIVIETNSYAQTIDNLDYECTAEEYIDGCRLNNIYDGDYFAEDIGAGITAKVYEDEADPMFDEPVSITCAVIEEE